MLSSGFFLRRWCSRPLSLLWVLLGCTAVAWAAPVLFDIPAQPAALALTEFARQARVEVLFPFTELNAVQSTAVNGTFEPEAALGQLLRGTGFRFTRNRSGKFFVMREGSNAGWRQITGTVVMAGTLEGIPDVEVQLGETRRGVQTDARGRFLLQVVEVPEFLLLRAPGFATTRVTKLAMTDARSVSLGSIPLTRAEAGEGMAELVVQADALPTAELPIVALQAVVVTPSRFGLDQDTGGLAATLSEQELQALPQLGEDVYRAISHLPGLAADDYTAKFWVRGAPHEQVLARYDGVDLVEPFHLKDTDSTLSILDLESIHRLDLYTGGFTAEYGQAAAGVIAIETDTPERSDRRHSVGVSLTGARLADRGVTADGRTRWLVSARGGLPDVALRDRDEGTEMKLRYYDVTAKWQHVLSPAHSVSVHLLHAGDTGEYTETGGTALTSKYQSNYLWARWRATLDRLTAETVLAGSWLEWRRDGSGFTEDDWPATVRERRDLELFSFRHDLAVALSPTLLLKAGLEAKQGAATYDYRGTRERWWAPTGVVEREKILRIADVSPDGTSYGGYASARTQLGESLVVEGGLRYDGNTIADDADVSPRLNAVWTRGRMTLRAAWGWYHQAQALHELAASDDDVRFYRSERAEHRVLSLEQRFRSGLAARVEVYERRGRHPRPRWENVRDAIAAFPELEPDRVRLEPETSLSRGVELIVERRARGPFSWAATYAWARSEETLRGGRTIPRARDQRHTVYLDATYQPSPRWQFSAAAQYHTGWPTTDWTFSRFPLTDGSTVIARFLGPTYGTRLPSYQRLDLRAQRRFQLRNSELRVYVDVFNVLGRDNTIEYHYRVNSGTNHLGVTRTDGARQVSRLPTVGLAWDF